MRPFSRVRLLVVTRHSPLPENDGAGAYLFDLLAFAAARGVRIEVAWFQPPGNWIRRGWCRVPANLHRVCSLQLPGALAFGRWRFFWWGAVQARLFHAVKTTLQFLRLHPAPAIAAAASAETPAVAAPAAWTALPSAAELRFAARRARRFAPTAMLANYCWLTPCFGRAAPANTCVLAHDVISDRLARLHPELGEGADGLSPASPHGESLLLGKARVVLAISADDAAFFHDRLGQRHVLVIPKAASPAAVAREAPVPQRCLFVGGANEPNHAGLAWFCTNIWPLVRAMHAEATLHVCGSVCEAVDPAPAGVTLRGRVPDLAPEYHAAEVVVVPLLAGTGVKIKLVEAASYGKACVTTNVGLQGLGFLRPAVACAEGAIEFAARLNGLLASAPLRVTLENQARNAVMTHLSPDACYGPFLETLAENFDHRASH